MKLFYIISLTVVASLFPVVGFAGGNSTSPAKHAAEAPICAEAKEIQSNYEAKFIALRLLGMGITMGGIKIASHFYEPVFRHQMFAPMNRAQRSYRDLLMKPRIAAYENRLKDLEGKILEDSPNPFSRKALEQFSDPRFGGNPTKPWETGDIAYAENLKAPLKATPAKPILRSAVGDIAREFGPAAKEGVSLEELYAISAKGARNGAIGMAGGASVAVMGGIVYFAAEQIAATQNQLAHWINHPDEAMITAISEPQRYCSNLNARVRDPAAAAQIAKLKFLVQSRTRAAVDLAIENIAITRATNKAKFENANVMVSDNTRIASAVVLSRNVSTDSGIGAPKFSTGADAKRSATDSSVAALKH